MPMDAVFLHGLTQELTQTLTGARIDKVQQPERDLLLLSVRTQGGNAKDVQYAFDKLGHGAAIMAGRSVLYAWQRQDDGADHYQQYAREAALKMREQILGYISVL